jgi:signal transduction histidine kinase
MSRLSGAPALRSLPGRAEDPACLVRHAAILLATLAAYLFRESLRAGEDLLWVLGVAALLNFVVFCMSTHRALSAPARILSPLVGLSSWTALVHVTGGVRSPYVAGLGLELILSALVFGPAGTAIISGGAAAGLWAQQITLGYGGARTGLALQTALLLSIGGVASFVRGRWGRDREALEREAVQARERLRVIEQEIEDLRVLGQVGVNVARLGHALKNAVAALKGFTLLVEPPGRIGAGDEEIHHAARRQDERIRLGLRSAVDRLEAISKEILQPAAPPERSRRCSEAREAADVLTEAIRDASMRHPGVRWTCADTPGLRGVRCPSGTLREVLGVLLDNAAEAMSGAGEVVIAASSGEAGLEVEVRDAGCGIGPGAIGNLFRPGRTTKPEGSGFGLYLARRLLEARGGTIRVSASQEGGATFGIVLPLGEAGS